MRSLYLLRPHGTAGIEGEQLVVRSEEQELDRMGLPLLDQILVVGQMQLTTQLIRACLRRGIPIAYLSSSGHCLGRLQPLEGGYRHRARRQAELPQERRLALARALVSGKIANGRVVLQRFTRRSGRPAVESCLRRLGQLQTLTSRAPCPNHLRGLEGSAAALYFRSLGGLLEPDGFGTRRAQPAATNRKVVLVTAFGPDVIARGQKADAFLGGVAKTYGAGAGGAAGGAAEPRGRSG